jgi:hypothetical protein
MGIYNFLRALGGLRAQSDEQLAHDRKALQLRHVAGEDHYDELHRYDAEMTRRENEAYDRQHPDPPAPRHRQHGWYLPNDE